MSDTRILVVDDDPMIVRLLERALASEGRVATAGGGAEALARIRELEPELLFLDAMMPEPDGYSVCREVRADASLTRQPYIIMLTAAGQEADRRRAEQAGVDEFMTKPFSPSQLRLRVREILTAEP